MSDIIDELTRDVKDERVQKLFMNWVPRVLYVTFAIIVIMLVKSWLADMKMDNHNKTADKFHKSVVLYENSENALSIESLDNMIEMSDNRAVDLARLYQIKILFNNNDLLDSQKRLENIFISDSRELTKSYARLLWCQIELKKDKKPKMLDDVEKNFVLSSSTDNIFYGNGALLYSLWLLRYDRNDEAKSILEKVMNSEVPASVKSSASAILYNL